MPLYNTNSINRCKKLLILIVRSKIFIGLSVALIALVAYSSSLNSDFFLDDYLHLTRSSSLAGRSLLDGWYLKASELEPYWWIPNDIAIMYFRPLITLTFALDQQIWGTIPFGYHLTNLLGHFLVTFFVYRIGVHIVENKTAVYLASVFFLLLPAHAGAVQWISGRTDVFMTLFYLIGFNAYLNLKLGNVRRRLNSVITVIAFSCSLLAKETAIIFQLVLLLYEIIIERRFRKGVPLDRARLAVLVTTVLISATYVLIRLPILFGGKIPQPYLLPFSADSFLDGLIQLILYILSCVFCIPILPFQNLEAWKLQTPFLGVLAVLLAVLLWLTWKKYRNNRSFVFWSLWFLVTLLPSLPVMMGQRLVYLPSVGFCFALGMACSDWWFRETNFRRHAKWHNILLSALVALYTSLTFAQGRILSSLSGESQKMTQKMVEFAARQPPNCHVFIINAWMPNSFLIGQSIKWIARDMSLNVRVLTLSPLMAPSGYGSRDQLSDFLLRLFYGSSSAGLAPLVIRKDDRTLVLESEESGFFDSPFGQFFLLGKVRFEKNEEMRTRDFTARISRVEGNSVQEISFTFPDSLTSPKNLFLICRGFDVDRIEFGLKSVSINNTDLSKVGIEPIP